MTDKKKGYFNMMVIDGSRQIQSLVNISNQFLDIYLEFNEYYNFKNYIDKNCSKYKLLLVFCACSRDSVIQFNNLLTLKLKSQHGQVFCIQQFQVTYVKIMQKTKAFTSEACSFETVVYNIYFLNFPQVQVTLLYF